MFPTPTAACPTMSARSFRTPGTDFLLDVRQPSELVLENCPGAVNIPLTELHARLDELPRGREIKVFCRSAQRAHYATRILLQKGFQATNLSGGMLARGMRSFLAKP